MPIDYNLYSKFWSLQEFFSKPNSCYDKASWKLFTAVIQQQLDFLLSKFHHLILRVCLFLLNKEC